MRRLSPATLLILTGIVVILLTGSCGTTRNTALSRRWQAFTTRYNVYFNGREHYDRTMEEMLRGYEDDYTRLLPVDPGAARADKSLPQPSGNYTRTIEKMQKAIQLHSIKRKPQRRSASPEERRFRERGEFNPFLHNAWMLMAKSQYYNGDFLGAATTFQYISRHFGWLPSTVTEARLWQAMSYCALGWRYEAENALHAVKEKDLVSGSLRLLYDKAMASLEILRKDYAAATGYIEKAALKSHGPQGNRLWFLLGQLYASLGKKQEAYVAFEKAGKGERIPYRAKFNARIRRSEVYTGPDVKGEIGKLRRMTRYARNRDYLDQIYYAIGNLSLASGDTARAMRSYSLAVEKSKSKGLDEALAMLALGNLYFAKGEYVKAQKCYSGCITRIPENYPGYKEMRLRSDVLDRLAVYAGNVELQDSLLRLAALPEKERLKVCARLAKNYTDSLRRMEDDRKREETMAEREATPQTNIKADTRPEIFMPNTDRSWYFYNKQALAAGKAEFQRRWGSRKPEDDWRRRNKAQFSLGSDDGQTGDDSGENLNEGSAEENAADSTAVAQKGDPESAEYYLRQIPSTAREIRNANDIVQEGLYNMGLILKDQLEDYPKAEHEFMRLLDRYPDNIYRLDTYYNLYMMAVRRGDNAAAEKWRRLIVNDFPDSPYGSAMRDPDYFENLRRMHREEERLYEKAYDAYLSDRTGEVHEIADMVKKDFPLSKLMPKFVFVDALSYLTEGNNALFRSRIDTLLVRWPDTELASIAGNIAKGLREGRVPKAGGGNSRGMIWSTRLSADSVERQAPVERAKFLTEPDKPYYFVLVFPRDSVNSNRLLYYVAKFNFSSFVIKDFDLEQMSFGELGILVVKGFENLRELEYYRRRMSESDFVLPSGVRPVMIGKSNFELLLREGRSFEEYFRFEENPPAPDDLPEPEEPELSENSENSEHSEASENLEKN